VTTIRLPAAADALDALRSRLGARLITPASPDYDEARRLADFTADRRPRAIVRAASAADVAATVAYARDRGLPLAVCSGGHGHAFFGMVDGALVVDLSDLDAIHIDPAAGIARVGPGATSIELARAANAHGFALSTGDAATVGLGGLAAGGGIGLMVRKHGLAIDNLLRAEVVIAAGEIVAASATEHPDLFWAVRGGGANVGIVTEFTFRLAPVGDVLGGELMLPANRATLRGYLDYAVAAPDDLTTVANLMHAPPAPHVPPDRVGELVLSILVCWTGDVAEGERALAPLRALSEPVVDAVGIIPYPKTLIETPPYGDRARMMFADDLSDATLDAALAAVADAPAPFNMVEYVDPGAGDGGAPRLANAPAPFSMVQFRALGGAMARVPADATAFAHRDRRFLMIVIGLWFDPAEEPARYEFWVSQLWQSIRHEGRGAYVNFLGDEGAERVRDAYPPATYARLAAVKRRWDPDNLFRFNQNVPPTDPSQSTVSWGDPAIDAEDHLTQAAEANAIDPVG
jgi:FAD/FMN-containing dehydrogenase